MLLNVVLCIMDLCCLVYCCKVLCGTCWERGRLPLVAAARKLDVVSIAERVMRAVREVGQSCTNSFSGACQRAVVAIWALLLILGKLLLTSLLLLPASDSRLLVCQHLQSPAFLFESFPNENKLPHNEARHMVA